MIHYILVDLLNIKDHDTFKLLKKKIKNRGLLIFLLLSFHTAHLESGAWQVFCSKS